ncbi:MAG: hypothetical protein GX275_00235 [Clostridiales bacterium]|nr:hypothetical protein [Clostridiales bacterium]
MRKTYVNKDFLPYTILKEKESREVKKNKRLILIFLILFLGLLPYTIKGFYKEKPIVRKEIKEEYKYESINKLTEILGITVYSEKGEISKGECSLIVNEEGINNYLSNNGIIKIKSIEKCEENMYKIKFKVE